MKFSCAIFFTMITCLGTGCAAQNKTQSKLSTQKIDICEYSRANIKAFESKMSDIILNQNNINLASFFKNAPSLQGAKKIPVITHQITGVPLGKTHFVVFECPVYDRNLNMWVLGMLENKEGKATKLEVNLYYADEDFPQRKEPLSYDQFILSEDLVNAINQSSKALYMIREAFRSKIKARSITREAFRSKMLEGGFLLHRSCADTDIYLVPPWPPTSISALVGINFQAPHPQIIGATVTFSSENSRFLHATVPRGTGSGECQFISALYSEQRAAWLMRWWIDHYSTYNI